MNARWLDAANKPVPYRENTFNNPASVKPAIGAGVVIQSLTMAFSTPIRDEKSEIRISKFETNSNDKNSNVQNNTSPAPVIPTTLRPPALPCTPCTALSVVEGSVVEGSVVEASVVEGSVVEPQPFPERSRRGPDPDPEAPLVYWNYGDKLRLQNRFVK